MNKQDAWRMYAAAALGGGPNILFEDAARWADGMLAEEEKRFPKGAYMWADSNDAIPVFKVEDLRMLLRAARLVLNAPDHLNYSGIGELGSALAPFEGIE